MQVVVDSIIFELNPRGGVARLFAEILPRMCQMDDATEIHLLTNQRHGYGLGLHPHLQMIPLNPPLDRLIRPRYIFQPITTWMTNRIKQRATRELRRMIWHPTYYTLLPDWRGPVVITVHDMLYEMFPQTFRRLDDRFFRQQKQRCVQQADAVICISETTAQHLQSYINVPRDKIVVIPLAYSTAFRVLKETSAPVHRPYLLYIGGRRAYKNFDRLLESYRRWRYKEEVALVVVGNPWSPQEKQQISTYDLEGYILRMNPVDDTQLAHLYNQALAFVYPSLYEGFGIPLLEAAACGCPVIASDIPSSREVLGDVPIYFDPQDTDSLIDAMDVAVAEARTSSRTERGLLRAQQYSWDRCARQTLEVYRALSGK